MIRNSSNKIMYSDIFIQSISILNLIMYADNYIMFCGNIFHCENAVRKSCSQFSPLLLVRCDNVEKRCTTFQKIFTGPTLWPVCVHVYRLGKMIEFPCPITSFLDLCLLEAIYKVWCFILSIDCTTGFQYCLHDHKMFASVL